MQQSSPKHVRSSTWTPRDVKRSVHAKLPEALCGEIIEDLRSKNVKIWSGNYVEEHFPLWVYISLFRLVRGIGINALSKGLILFPFKTPNTSLAHNHAKIMEALYTWSKAQIVWGTQADWNEAAPNLARHKIELLRRVRLWADSSDFALRKKKEIKSKKGEHWSFKENRPAQRYMAICDGATRIRALWGGYSPKVYDSSFMKNFLAPYEESLKNVAIVGDNHFLAAGKYFKGRIEIVAPTTEPGKGKKRLRERDNEPAVGYAEETQEEARNNEAIRQTRARVEQVFGSIKERFKCLKPHFAGNMTEQDYAVNFGAAVHNWLLDNVEN